MTNSDADVDDLFDESDDKSRTDVAADDRVGVDDQTDLEAAIAEEYHRVRQSGAATTLSLRDERVAAIVRGLDEADDLGNLSADVWDAVPGEADGQPDSRSGLLSGLLRLGLKEADESLFETDRVAFRRYRDEHESQTR